VLLVLASGMMQQMAGGVQVALITRLLHLHPQIQGRVKHQIRILALAAHQIRVLLVLANGVLQQIFGGVQTALSLLQTTLITHLLHLHPQIQGRVAHQIRVLLVLALASGMLQQVAGGVQAVHLFHRRLLPLKRLRLRMGNAQVIHVN
jgi:hypothetical protein